MWVPPWAQELSERAAVRPSSRLPMMVADWILANEFERISVMELIVGSFLLTGLSLIGHITMVVLGYLRLPKAVNRPFTDGPHRPPARRLSTVSRASVSGQPMPA